MLKKNVRSKKLHIIIASGDLYQKNCSKVKMNMIILVQASE